DQECLPGMLVPGLNPVNQVIESFAGPAAQHSIPPLLIPELAGLFDMAVLLVPEWIAKCFDSDANVERPALRARRRALGCASPGTEQEHDGRRHRSDPEARRGPRALRHGQYFLKKAPRLRAIGTRPRLVRGIIQYASPDFGSDPETLRPRSVTMVCRVSKAKPRPTR